MVFKKLGRLLQSAMIIATVKCPSKLKAETTENKDGRSEFRLPTSVFVSIWLDALFNPEGRKFLTWFKLEAICFLVLWP